MLILGIDTSTSRLSLALRRGGTTLVEKSVVPHRRQAEAILPELSALLAEAGMAARGLQGVAVGLGPGSFTGLRVGAAVAQGLGQSLNLPVAGVSSFLAVAAAGGAETTLVVADARQEMLYAGLYARRGGTWEALWPESLLSAAETAARLPRAGVTLSGPGAEMFAGALAQAGAVLASAPDAQRFPDAAVIARLAEPALLAGGERPEAVVPHYLRRTQAEEVRSRREREAAP